MKILKVSFYERRVPFQIPRKTGKLMQISLTYFSHSDLYEMIFLASCFSKRGLKVLQVKVLLAECVLEHAVTITAWKVPKYGVYSYYFKKVCLKFPLPFSAFVILEILLLSSKNIFMDPVPYHGIFNQFRAFHDSLFLLRRSFFTFANHFVGAFIIISFNQSFFHCFIDIKLLNYGEN